MRSEQAVYVEKMIDLCRGTPLFEPDPEYGRCGPQIGDVGYIHEVGRFMPIFNIFSAKTNASGIKIKPILGANGYVEVDTAGVPAPEDLKLQELLQIATLVEGQPYKSKSVSYTEIQAGAETGG